MIIRCVFYLTAVLITPSLIGCTNGYRKYYTPADEATLERIENTREQPPSHKLLVERARLDNLDALLDNYAKRSYVTIGYSSFSSGQSESEDDAIAQAHDVFADLVLILNPKYEGTTTTLMPLTTPDNTTSYSSGTATAYGSHGAVTAHVNSTTSTYGTTTTYIPIDIHRSSYGALYFVKIRSILGAFFRDLTDDEKKELQTNKGATVRLIIDESPAYNADILAGDIVTSLDGVTVKSAQSLSKLLDKRRGKAVSISMIRREKRIEKTIQLNP